MREGTGQPGCLPLTVTETKEGLGRNKQQSLCSSYNVPNRF